MVLRALHFALPLTVPDTTLDAEGREILLVERSRNSHIARNHDLSKATIVNYIDTGRRCKFHTKDPSSPSS